MEKLISRKIKVLQFDNVGEYKDLFLQFGQNNDIGIHFTVRKQIEIAKELNCALLEKVRYLLSNASLDKSFWVEVLVYASYLMNRLSLTVIGGKTLWDIWSGGAAQDFSLL